MTIMSVSASRHSSGFSIQSILGDIDKKQTSEKKEEDKKIKKFNVEIDKCNSCSLNQNEVEHEHNGNLQARLYGGHFDTYSNDNLLRKLQYAQYGHYLSQEYMSRTQEDFRHIWHNSEESCSNLYLPLRLHNNFQPRGQGQNQDFLFSHLRKPKRVRTAFSPSQLLRLEHAFENNHYVVGQERKELAAGLALTETQVKVWFQNRRTKHKRIRAEDEMTRSLARSLEKRETTDASHVRYNTSDSESEIDI